MSCWSALDANDMDLYLLFFSILAQEFHFPFAVVLYHLVLKLVMAGVARNLYRCFTGKSRVQIDWRKSFKKLAPTGIAAGIDIGFSNWGLELVTISLYVLWMWILSIYHYAGILSYTNIVWYLTIRYTMTKSSTIVFILFFAILFGLEKKVFCVYAFSKQQQEKWFSC